MLRELKCSQLSELFSDFSAQPVAAASLGQVGLTDGATRLEGVKSHRKFREHIGKMTVFGCGGGVFCCLLLRFFADIECLC